MWLSGAAYFPPAGSSMERMKLSTIDLTQSWRDEETIHSHYLVIIHIVPLRTVKNNWRRSLSVRKKQWQWEFDTYSVSLLFKWYFIHISFFSETFRSSLKYYVSTAVKAGHHYEAASVWYLPKITSNRQSVRQERRVTTLTLVWNKCIRTSPYSLQLTDHIFHAKFHVKNVAFSFAFINGNLNINRNAEMTQTHSMRRTFSSKYVNTEVFRAGSRYFQLKYLVNIMERKDRDSYSKIVINDGLNIILVGSLHFIKTEELCPFVLLSRPNNVWNVGRICIKLSQTSFHRRLHLFHAFSSSSINVTNFTALWTSEI
jgi:hypothetical protein